MAASNHIVFQSYETKIEELEQQKALVAETLHSQPQKPDSFEDKLEPVLTFFANPWKLWETGHTTRADWWRNWPLQSALSMIENWVPEPRK
ncbi:hypothetical protein CEW89_00360 [Celeribacter ethanolicus]|uniref:Uncharacterized protein n=1 Tax=Celeribacter ethanolicus TaxID=1758178 RepID=A0A291G808_9RHOB|nr:hypothetical protein [Celeribacter ethanolicus]ATG46156.1 hypothetical protein CEW89_00360 [Celeribacter ethanolicus]